MASSQQTGDDELTLMQAAFSLGVSRERALRMILTRRIDGRRTPDGWRVRRSSVRLLTGVSQRSAAVG